MNIAIFASAFHPHFGGVEELCRQLAHELKRRDLEVIVITNRWPRNLPEFEEFEGIPIYRVAMRVPDGSIKAKSNFYLTHSKIQKQVEAILQKNKIDVAHVQCVSSNGLYAMNAARQLNLPLVVTMQGELTMDASQLYQRSAYAQQLLREVLTAADKITACSQKTLDDGQNFYGKPFGDRGVVVFNGARTKDFDSGQPFQHPRPYIFAIGRVVPQKGFDNLIRAYAQANVGEHDLIIAGDGPDLPGLKQLATEVGVANRVIFTGKADREKAVSLFLGASFFVLPSRADEGLPVVCAEALAAGKAVIATRSGGAPEAILHGQTGFIVEKDDVDGLAEAIGLLAAEPTRRQHFGKNAKVRSSVFAWPHIAQQYLDVYEAALLAAPKRANTA